MSKQDAVWITGAGTANPLGHSFDQLADNLLAGRSGVGLVEFTDATGTSSQLAARLAPIQPPPGWDAAAFAMLSNWEQTVVWCGVQALRDAGLWDKRESLRIGLILGVAAEWLLTWEADMHRGGHLVQTPSAGHTSLVELGRQHLGLSGPVATVAAACASGNVAIAQGRRWVERGWVDVCLAGGCDRSVTPMTLAGFGNLGALSKRSDNPQAASRPFDAGRDGFVVGEGGALCVLERAEGARRRGARAYAEVVGCGSSSDAFHLVIPSPDPVPASRAMRTALEDAALAPDQIDYLNAHATSTPVGDRFETRVLQSVLGEAARTVPVSATKSMTGHLLAAAAAVEAIACLVALDRQAIPPTINLDQPDAECVLNHVAHEARPQKLRVVLSNSFGFGGCNTCLVLRKVA